MADTLLQLRQAKTKVEQRKENALPAVCGTKAARAGGGLWSQLAVTSFRMGSDHNPRDPSQALLLWISSMHIKLKPNGSPGDLALIAVRPLF